MSARSFLHPTAVPSWGASSRRQGTFAAGFLLSEAGPRTPLGGRAGARLSSSNPEAGKCEFEANQSKVERLV